MSGSQTLGYQGLLTLPSPRHVPFEGTRSGALRRHMTTMEQMACYLLLVKRICLPSVPFAGRCDDELGLTSWDA